MVGPRFRDLSGQVFGRLTVVQRIENTNPARWVCNCSCGSQTIAIAATLKQGTKRSCGCLAKEMSRARRIKHGDSLEGGRKIGRRLYRIWSGMKARCQIPTAGSYIYYGARGIQVCDAWRDYEGFKAWAMNHGYEDTLQIDRIDNDGDYSPENCRWVTVSENAKNRKVNLRGEDGKFVSRGKVGQ